MSEPVAPTDAPYRVLARKYRPAAFRELIGQAAMVRTLTNALATGRIAHAFLLTGVRGVGKTTTARIIARALNCVGPDGDGGPATEPCGRCEHCRAIAEDRHLDVIEMDAASRTGVNDIRELIEGVRYGPVTARFKVYIIDEVHMLSTPAFNALLKTLEEPPAHVKFVFATTEARKIPVTVLSRCQRFDLRRVEMATLIEHFAAIAEKEGIAVEPAALALIARAAEGSVRDGLSLLDQAIALAAGKVSEAEVRRMLGLADRSQLFDLFDRLMSGDVKGALDLMGDMYRAGADPAAAIEDLLDLTHWLTRIKVAPEAAEASTVPENERARGRDMAGRLSLAALARAWQMLLKGLSEVQGAPHPLQAAEMAMVRLAHVADWPTPGELVGRLVQRPSAGDGAPAGRREHTGPIASLPASEPQGGRPLALLAGGGSEAAPSPAAPQPQSFAEVARLFEVRREAILHTHLVHSVHLVRFEPGRIEFRPAAEAPANLANRLGSLLGEWTGRRWIVAVSEEEGLPTLSQQAAAADRAARQAVLSHPLVAAVTARFPGAVIEAVRPLDAAPPASDTEPPEGAS